ncbi:MAG: phospho-sugar mutase, partial [Bacteriovoracaceae bacterium]|nr:phospho-sugar mutase [Bacteriovoracaceae bacterium]
GVMVTASHNPPEYNGFKVFWADGAQVTPPYDENIIHHYNQLQDFSLIQYMDFEAGLSRGLIHWMNEEMESKYHRAIESTVVDKKLCLERGNELKIVYTPIHGAGLIPCTTALKNIGFKNIEVVSEQAQPNGNFPTVKSPNPENPSALKMAVDLMIKTGADIAMGSDPDTDRLGVAFLDRNNEVIYVNGNQIGILKLHYILAQKKKMGQLKANSYFVKSIVTSSLQDHIAKAFHVETYNTLTGFKWICGKMNELEHTAPEKNFIFATEESFGYLSHTFARDKDGISSVTLMAEVALFYKLQGLNLNEALDKIYAEFGFSHETVLSIDYFGIEGQEKIARIMNNLREMKHSPLAFEELETLKDYKLGIEGLPKSNVLGFFFQSGNQLYARPSGTEPKIKFYLMIRETNGSLEEKKKNAYKKTEEALKIIKEFSEKA